MGYGELVLMAIVFLGAGFILGMMLFGAPQRF